MAIHKKIINRVVGTKNGRATIFVSTLLLLTVFIVAANSFAVNPVSAAFSPSLGAAQSFSVLGGQAVTCTGASHVSGDVGIAPAAATFITGFPSPCTIGPPGANQGNDAAAIAAQGAVGTAFGQLDQVCTQSFGAQDLSGLSLGPGVYCSTSSFSLTGTLTLTGTGDWIFKTVSTFITGSGSQVVGGDPCRVWWRVGSSATLGSGSALIGNVIAGTGSVGLNSGAVLNGRAFAQSGGSVTLTSNQVTGPNCAIVTTSIVTTILTTITSGGTTFTSSIITTITQIVIPEYPLGVVLLMILMLPIYMLLKKRNSGK